MPTVQYFSSQCLHGVQEKDKFYIFLTKNINIVVILSNSNLKYKYTNKDLIWILFLTNMRLRNYIHLIYLIYFSLQTLYHIPI